jgi:hypothetical protein
LFVEISGLLPNVFGVLLDHSVFNFRVKEYKDSQCSSWANHPPSWSHMPEEMNALASTLCEPEASLHLLLLKPLSFFHPISFASDVFCS